MARLDHDLGDTLALGRTNGLAVKIRLRTTTTTPSLGLLESQEIQEILVVRSDKHRRTVNHYTSRAAQH